VQVDRPFEKAPGRDLVTLAAKQIITRVAAFVDAQ
jgi:hypothetical protein